MNNTYITPYLEKLPKVVRLINAFIITINFFLKRNSSSLIKNFVVELHNYWNFWVALLALLTETLFLVSFVVVKTSSVVTLVVVTVVYCTIKRLEIMSPPTYKSPPIPTPPLTCREPLCVDVAVVPPDIMILVAVIVAVVSRPLSLTISASINKLVPVADIFTKVPVLSNDKESPSLTEPIVTVSGAPAEVCITSPPPFGSTERVVPPRSIVCPATYNLPNRLVGEPRSCNPSVSGINLNPVLSVTVLV